MATEWIRIKTDEETGETNYEASINMQVWVNVQFKLLYEETRKLTVIIWHFVKERKEQSTLLLTFGRGKQR